MQNTLQDYVIVGAGITGLSLARELSALNSNLKVQVVEKSKSCGGRMATRRVGESRFDHGAQFIKNSESSNLLIEYWAQRDSLQKFQSSSFEASCGRMGMNQLAKKMTENINATYNFKANRIESTGPQWILYAEDGQKFEAKNIIITAPLPQALAILASSGVSFSPGLGQISYSKALVFLVQFDSALSADMDYIENLDSEIFVVCSQKAKELSTNHDYVLTMQTNWSETHFEKSDDEILNLGLMMFKEKFARAHILNMQIKKWRYSQPSQIWNKLFDCPAPGLFLAGDAFGGPSLNGALRSSAGLASFLKLQHFNPELMS